MVSILATRNNVFTYRSNNCLFTCNIFEMLTNEGPQQYVNLKSDVALLDC